MIGEPRSSASASSQPWKFSDELNSNSNWKDFGNSQQYIYCNRFLGYYQLLDLQKGLNSEFQYVETLFYKNMSPYWKGKFKITSIQALRNTQLLKMFEGR